MQFHLTHIKIYKRKEKKERKPLCLQTQNRPNWCFRKTSNKNSERSRRSGPPLLPAGRCSLPGKKKAPLFFFFLISFLLRSRAKNKELQDGWEDSNEDLEGGGGRKGVSGTRARRSPFAKERKRERESENLLKATLIRAWVARLLWCRWVAMGTDLRRGPPPYCVLLLVFKSEF
ncbi:hypothetical protein CEXT_231091 [Caerostris extrusa]|uniref:Uncharacterized protein n=1 Tax=Caerostris extrusa TaxID=172846 RepID=A0AAV4R4G8_CAEEX|nr:hypothetical protein CEXT_231091 [Caerostris extrusa]